MRGRTRATLLMAPLLVVAAGAVATAAPASADCGTVVCATSNDNGHISAATSYVTITVRGGSYHSRSGPVEIPNQVPPPCWYTKGRSGAEMYADSQDPQYYALAHHTGEDHDEWFPPIVADHKDDDGNWYSWECSSGNFDGSIQDFFKYVDAWTAQNPDLVWVPAGQAPPQPPVPPEILMGIARQIMDDAVQMPVVNFNPATRGFVRLETWMWFDPAAWEPVSVTASGGGNSVTVTATPERVGVSGVPAGSQVETGCADGGKAYVAGGATDCSITFSQASGTQPGQQWHFQVGLTWNVTATGAPLQGPATITRTEDEALTIQESQTVTGAGN
ncbi:MAG TPA: hypothetical protein VLM05_18840 [Mycobacteriales bacterium]|nr:hypothetical protein [Mycobacteriales bacterium]